jgi:uncharacterized protein YukE
VSSVSLGATLATCADPRVLVPGSPEALRADADDLDEQSRALADHVTELQAAQPESWTGTSADAWSGRRAQFAQALDTVSEIHATAAATLRLHAEALTWGHERAATAIRMYARGCDLRDAELGSLAAVGAPRQVLAADAGAGHRALAESVLLSAQEQVAASARAASAVLDELSAGLPDGRWHLGDFARGMWSWIAGAAELVWKFNSLRGVIDPGGALRDRQEMFDAALDTYDGLTDDPIGTAERLAQLDLLRDRPAQWWGQLTPDIALAAAGGLGGASAGLRGLRAADDVASSGSDLAASTRSLYSAGSRWADPAERARWLDEHKSDPANRQSVTNQAPWAVHQRAVTGTDLETRLYGGGERIWADDAVLDPDAVAAIDVKYTGTPGASPYDGTANPFAQKIIMDKFDNEMMRYGAVITDESNPVARLRLSVTDQASADFLEARARGILGPDIDLQIVIESR